MPHKKRGRPRLREDTDFRVDTTAHQERPSTSGSATGLPTGERPVAAMRHRRGESLRTLRSSISSASGVSVTSPTSYGRPSSRSIETVYGLPPQSMVIPTAFLDLDLVIVKANSAFQNLFAGVQDIRGRRLGDIARPTDADSFQAVRNMLREEREEKEPHYLPPILQHGHDPLNGTTERDLDDVTRGFEDRRYMWTYTLHGGLEQTLSTRVRLAKSSAYFVTLALPSLPIAQVFAVPGQGPPSTTLPSPISLTGPIQAMPPPLDPLLISRGPPAQSAPPSPFYSYHNQRPFSQSSATSAASSSSRTYPPPPAQMHSHAQYTQQREPFPQLRSPPIYPQYGGELGSMAAPSDPFASRFAAARRLSAPLPPLTEPLGPPLLPQQGTGIQTMSQQPQQPRQQQGLVQSGAMRQESASSSDSAKETLKSPRKRRRTGMEIGDVLH